MRAFALTPQSHTAKEALREAVMRLQAEHIETASLDARLLLEHALGVSREQLLMALDEPLTAWQEDAYRDLVDRRARRQPVAQLIGRREFYGLDFRVTEHTLDPRPDSETIIQALVKAMPDRDAPLRILDLGTGTGCLLLTLLNEFPNASGVGVDKCPHALRVAMENAAALGVKTRAQFMLSDWCEKIEGNFDIIVSNPPYIPTRDIADCPPEVSQHEPKLALDGGEDGLDCYRTIIAALPRFLAKRGMAALEMGIGQQQALETLAVQHALQVHAVRHDIQHLPRCILLTPNHSL